MMNLLMYLKAKSEGKNLRSWWKGESSLGIAYSGPINYTHRLRYTKLGSYLEQPKLVDTTMSGSLAAKVGFSFNGNSNHLLARLSENSILALSIGFEGEIIPFEDMSNFVLSDNGRNATETSSAGYYQMGIPITLDYKWGCDVDFNPELKACFAAGGGLMPMYSTIGDINGMHVGGLRMPPYVYASVGFYAWGCWKLRASYIPGAFVDWRGQEGNNLGTLTQTSTIKGSNVFTIGISTMSFSQDWRDGRGDRGPGIGGGGGGNSGNGRRSRRHGGTMRMF